MVTLRARIINAPADLRDALDQVRGKVALIQHIAAFRRRRYITRDAKRQDVFDDIEIFYNPDRKHTNNGMPSPVDHEIKHQRMNEAGV